jgi:hypothetical protein
MNFLGPEALVVLPFVVILLPLIGTSGKWLIGSAMSRNWKLAFPAKGNLLLRVIEDFALGTALVPIFFAFANGGSVPLTSGFAYAIVIVSVAISAYRLYLLGRNSLGSLWGFLRSSRWEIAALAGITGLALIFRLAPYWNLYVFSGDDIRTYTLLAQSVVSQGKLPMNWNPYSFPSWNPYGWIDNHLFFTGTESIFAFLSFMVPVDLPQMTSSVAIIFNAAVPLMGYALVRALFPKASRSAALVTGVVLAAVSVFPLFFEQTGEIDEIIGWVVLLGVVTNYLGSMTPEGIDWRRQVLGGVLLGGLLEISPIVFVYGLCFFIAFWLEAVLSNQRRWRTTETIASQLVIGLVIAIPVLLMGIHNALQTGPPPGTSGWGAFAASPILRYGDWGGSIFRLVTLTSFFYSVTVVIGGWSGIVVGVLRRRTYMHAPAIALWAVFLFLLNENGPFGLYLVKYPEWNWVFPDRVVEFLLVLLSVGVGVLVAYLLAHTGWRSEANPNMEYRRHPDSRLLQTSATVLLCIVVVGSGITSCEAFSFNSSAVTAASSVTSADLAAFSWIEGNVPKGSTVLVNEHDAGTWLPAMDGIRVFPYVYLMTNESIVDNYDTMVSQLSNRGAPDFTMYSALGQEFNLSYSFFGSKVGYGFSDPFPASVLYDSPPVTNYATHLVTACPTSSNTSIQLCSDNDTVTIQGPIALFVSVLENDIVTTTYQVNVPVNMTFTYVLHGSSSQQSGTSGVRITAQPPATIDYGSSNTMPVVMSLDQGYFASSCSPLPPNGTCDSVSALD